MSFADIVQHDAILAAALQHNNVTLEHLLKEMAEPLSQGDFVNITPLLATPNISLYSQNIQMSWPPEASSLPHVAKCPHCGLDHGAGFYYYIDQDGSKLSIVNLELPNASIEGVIGQPLSRVIDVAGAQSMVICKITSYQMQPEFCPDTILWVRPA